MRFCCLPLRGGSGLKCVIKIGKVYRIRLPLRGGSGLKFGYDLLGPDSFSSPSARREWIEIFWLLRNEDRDSFPLEVKWIEIPGNWCHMKKMLMNFAANT